MAKKKKSSLHEADALISSGVITIFVGVGLYLSIEKLIPPYAIPIFIGLGLISAGILKKLYDQRDE
jgi:hypothetical protein